ncbi:hypothetical protein QYM36_011279, partial [Artemia franciscana]
MRYQIILLNKPKQPMIEKKRLFNQFKTSNADIVCLQEVDADYYYNTYLSYFQSKGYDGVFKQKTQEKIDGCATFFKKCKFSLKENHSLEMLKNGIDLLNRDNIALISILTPFKNPDKQICIVNTHLLYNRKREDVRLAQLQVLLAEINRVACKITNDPPVILCGDLNFTPSSRLYSFLSQGRLKYEHLDIKKLTNCGSQKIGKTFLPKELYISDSCQYLQELKRDNCIEEEFFSSGTLTHKFAFKSVYNSDEFPKVRLNSTCHNLVDYILYSNIDEKFNKHEKQELILLERLRLPTYKDCLKIGPLPN